VNILSKFDQAEYEKIVEREKREAVEKAEAKGRAEERAEMMKEELAKVAHAVSEGDLTADRAAELFGFSIDEIECALRKKQR